MGARITVDLEDLGSDPGAETLETVLRVACEQLGPAGYALLRVTLFGEHDIVLPRAGALGLPEDDTN